MPSAVDSRRVDNLTHSLLGLALGRAGLADRFGKGSTALLVVASNIPDVDAVAMLLWRDEAAWLRRTHTHCIVGGPIVALLLGLTWWAASRGRMKLPVALGLSLLGVGGHVLLDLFNSYGVVALWPFSLERFELAWVYIIDLALWAILLAPIILARVLRSRLPPTRIYQGALAAFTLYVAVCAAGHWCSGALLQQRLSSEGTRASFTCVFPEALGPHRWRAVARDGQRLRVWLVHPVDGRMDLVGEFMTQDDDPRLAAIRTTARARSVERFFKAAVWTVDPDGTRATCLDLRFMSAVIDRGRAPFEYEFKLGSSETAPTRS